MATAPLECGIVSFDIHLQQARTLLVNEIGGHARFCRRCVAHPVNKKRLISQAFPFGGDEETRTPDPLHAKQVLYQLSYIPMNFALRRYGPQRGNAQNYTRGAAPLSKNRIGVPAPTKVATAPRVGASAGGRGALNDFWESFSNIALMAGRSAYVTRPREQIASILRDGKRFISAAEIHRALDAARSRVSLSTVYRTLEHLVAKSEVSVRIDQAGESTYMLCEPERHHHHAICRVCGRVDDVDCTAIEQFSESLRTLHGFEIDAHNMEFIGRCQACR